MLEQLQANFKFYDSAFKKRVNETFQGWFNNVMNFLWEVVKYHYEYVAVRTVFLILNTDGCWQRRQFSLSEQLLVVDSLWSEWRLDLDLNSLDFY